MRVHQTDFFLVHLPTRMPFKYGIATLTSVPHLILRSQVEINGKIHHGFAADNLPPKWFTKNPATSIDDDLRDMQAVIRHACAFAKEAGQHPTPFALWRATHDAQSHWARTEHPPLLANFGVSLIERTILDGFCRATSQPFHQALRNNSFGIILSDVHPELTNIEPRDVLPAQPLDRIIVRHTVGLSDPLTDADVTTPLNDGLPQTLERAIRAYGLTHFKIKLSGDIATDVSRLRDIAKLLDQLCPDYRFTLDANENYHALEPFQHLWNTVTHDRALDHFLSHLLFIEQPLHRDVALCDDSRRALLAWPDRPPMIIDESDDTFTALPRALDCGYLGTSHKNCKGIFKSLANLALITHRAARDPSASFILSAEDLTTIGPVSLLQDLAVIAALGIGHAERNGHHYIRGLAPFPSSIQDQLLTHHPDLYHRHPVGFPTLTINSGYLSTTTVTRSPLGLSFALDLTDLIP